MEQPRFNVGSYAIAFATGAVVGAIVAYLTAPRTGRETREALARSTQDLRRRAADGVTDMQDRVVRAGRAARDAFKDDGPTPRES